MRQKQIFQISLAILVTLFATTAFAKEVLKVGYLPILDHLTLIVSHYNDNSSFKEVDVMPKKFKSWGNMAGALKAGVIDAAFILSPLAMDLYNKGAAIQTILLAHRDGSAITVKKGSGIKSAADLKGKTIAIPFKISTHTALLGKYLSSAGLKLTDVKTPVIAPPSMEAAMKKGAIDAFVVAEPFGAKSQLDGVGEILTLTNNIIPHHVECIVVINRAYTEKHPAAVQEWVDSLIKAGKFITDDNKNNDSKKVDEIVAEKKYMGHNPKITHAGLHMPEDRISFNDLNPAKEGFIPIVDISRDANIIDNIDLDGFINEQFYKVAMNVQ
jgi:NitT/TauT family transport system substrate-binding protein